ncbi:hypothetical protein [Nitrospira moscoviensis]|uniref:Uncharacterized protein n=1 Tax=Nitrospira moscoviensis TaxID=42253 RepID=A0A0K2GBG7_NITMO|nr:hypothetical protein [Nitrospira moscoviensis]ALA58293.1 membrane protein of unknown function [Nitrospira moscoviensis]
MPTSTPDVYIEEHNLVIAPGAANSKAWPLYWGAIWVGALASIAAVLLFGLIGIAVGAHQVGKQAVRMSDITFAGLVFSVAGAFFSFVIGGWVAATIAGLRRAETASLQGSIVWLVALPLLLVFAALGAGGFFGGWYGGLAGTPVWASGSAATADPDAAIAARNSALGAMTALLIGLIGAVIGGWFASGEPMTVTAQRAKPELRQAA